MHQDTASENADHSPNPRAVLCGRLVFYFASLCMAVIPGAAASFGVVLETPWDYCCIAGGIVLVALGAILPPATAAQLGFNLPIVLPSKQWSDFDDD